MKVDLHVGVGDEVARLPLEEIGGEGKLLERLLVHEDVAAAVAVEELHLALVDVRPLDLVLRAHALVALGARLDVLHFNLHEGAPAATDVDVMGLEHAPDALLPLDQVAGADFGGENLGHFTACLKKGRILH